MPKVTKGKNTLESNEISEKTGKPEKKERCSYSVDQKQIVVEYALKHGRNAAARLYKIDKSMVGRWVKASEKWNADPTKVNWNSLRIGSGQKPLYEEAENQLHKWVSDQHGMGVEITNSNVRNKMYQILQQPEMKALYPDAEKEFKASSRWLAGFLARKKLTVLRDRPVFKKRPVCDVVLREYRQNIKRLRKEREFEFRNLFNMDELPVWFDAEGNLRVNLRREKEMKISDTFYKFTIILTCAADGTKYSPICVFRGTELPYGEKVPDSIIVWFHEDGIVSRELMFNYIDMLHVIRMMSNQSNKPAIMVHDKSMDPEGEIFQKFASYNISLAVIPNGTMLSVLQPIDIINKIFKDNLIKEWDKWNAITGIIRRATITDICGWVKNAWEEISKEVISDSFKKCRISSALNGSEDKAKFPTIDSIIKEIKADDANQRSRSQDDEFNSEYTIETETEEMNNNNEKTSENANEGTVTEIRAMFDEYVFTETDQLEGTSAFVPLSPETMHPDHTQSSHIHPTLLRTDFIQTTSNTNRRHSNINSAQYFR